MSDSRDYDGVVAPALAVDARRLTDPASIRGMLALVGGVLAVLWPGATDLVFARIVGLIVLGAVVRTTPQDGRLREGVAATVVIGGPTATGHADPTRRVSPHCAARGSRGGFVSSTPGSGSGSQPASAAGNGSASPHANLQTIRPSEVIDDLIVVERVFSEDDDLVSIGLANIHADVPDVERNKRKVIRAMEIFKERGVNVAVLPEFCLSGYFWANEDECRAYMNTAVLDEHVDWVENELKPILDDEFHSIALNALRPTANNKFHNVTLLITGEAGYLEDKAAYRKVFLPPIEKLYTETGRDDRLVYEGAQGRVGFTTCYDYLFSELVREYSIGEHVQAIVQVASWRAFSLRDYPGMNVRTDTYYGRLWDTVMAANSAINQIWTIACNAVGRHPITGTSFYGGSGIWAPSGLPLVQASHVNEELLIVHNLDIKGTRESELDDFNYALDFNEIYRPLEFSRTYTRSW